MKVLAADLGELGRPGKPRRLGRGVHEDVDATAQLPHRFGHGPARLSVAGGVGADADDLAAGLGGQLGGRRRECLRVAGQQRDVCAFLRQHARDGLADASAAAGHERPLAFELQIRGSPSRCDANTPTGLRVRGSAATSPPARRCRPWRPSHPVRRCRSRRRGHRRSCRRSRSARRLRRHWRRAA